MFSVTPYLAEYQAYGDDGAGGLKSTWKPCKVVGITTDSAGDPIYIVEITSPSESHLRTVEYVRRRP